MTEGPERNHPLGRRAGDPAGERGGVPGDEAFGGQSGQRGFADPVGSEDDGPAPGLVTQGDVQLLQGGRVLRHIPSNRHCRILWRAVRGLRRWSTFRCMSPESDSAGEWAVAVYCASGPTHPELLELAAQLGEAIAERGWTLVWGGGHVSAMGAVATAARARGGWTVGVIPKMLVHREVADHDADELIVTDTMWER